METHLNAILDKTVDGKRVFGASFAVKKGNSSWLGASGNLTAHQPYFIASTTKLFTTAIILHLKSTGRLSLNDRICNYLDDVTMSGLHLYRGRNYSGELTLKHLLAHTSGLPDYFQNKGPNGKSLEHELVGGNDQYWTFEQAIERAKAMQPLFEPGARGKAHYSDTNFQLLGRIIEGITGKSYSISCNELVIQPLGLKSTNLYLDPADRTPKRLHYRSAELDIPKAMASFGADGGMVSTSPDMLILIESFFLGSLFPANYLADMQVWNRIFFPMQSGVGIHLFKLPWLFNPVGSIPYFLGHSGLSGALAYWCPRENLYIAGTVNQVAHPDISFRTMIRITQALRNRK